MGEPRKLQKSDINRIMGVAGKQYKKVVWHTSEIVIRTFIPMSEYVELVDNIIDYCLDDNGSVNPAMIDFSIKANIIARYAFVVLPDSAEELYRIVYCTDLYDCIARNISKSQIDSIFKAVSIFVGCAIS